VVQGSSLLEVQRRGSLVSMDDLEIDYSESLDLVVVSPSG
jgi:hypothetical protein